MFIIGHALPCLTKSLSVKRGHPFVRAALIVAVTRNPFSFKERHNSIAQNQLSKNTLKCCCEGRCSRSLATTYEPLHLGAFESMPV